MMCIANNQVSNKMKKLSKPSNVQIYNMIAITNLKNYSRNNRSNYRSMLELMSLRFLFILVATITIFMCIYTKQNLIGEYV